MKPIQNFASFFRIFALSIQLFFRKASHTIIVTTLFLIFWANCLENFYSFQINLIKSKILNLIEIRFYGGHRE